MVKFLNEIGSSSYLEDLIKGAKDNLILISPGFQFTDTMKALLINLSEQNRNVRLICNEDALKPEENSWLLGLIGIRTSFCNNLQSRCYISEHEAIVTSTDLYGYSQQNNSDMGIYITKEKDKSLYNSTLQEVELLLSMSYN